MNNRVLVDTSAFYALIANDDAYHQTARTCYASLMDQQAELYTTSYVMVECVALIHRRLGFTILNKFVESIRDSVRIIWVDGPSHWKAWELVKARSGRGPSLVDCTVLAVAESLGATVFAFDEDFAREGIAVIPRTEFP